MEVHDGLEPAISRFVGGCPIQLGHVDAIFILYASREHPAFTILHYSTTNSIPTAFLEHPGIRSLEMARHHRHLRQQTILFRLLTNTSQLPSLHPISDQLPDHYLLALNTHCALRAHIALQTIFNLIESGYFCCPCHSCPEYCTCRRYIKEPDGSVRGQDTR